jgi:hypothetical protein
MHNLQAALQPHLSPQAVELESAGEAGYVGALSIK